MCNYDIEKELLKKEYRYICGVDEVGRGALFGPVVAGAVILNPENLCFELKDSKKLSGKKRIELSHFVYESALAYSIGWCCNDEIDDTDILAATKKSMKMAVKGLQISPDYVLIDAMRPDFLDIEGQGIIKGDARSISIAAASIIAKVFRDQLLETFAGYFPGYGLHEHKGYPTRKHINALRGLGITEFHRKSYRGVEN